MNSILTQEAVQGNQTDNLSFRRSYVPWLFINKEWLSTRGGSSSSQQQQPQQHQSQQPTAAAAAAATEPPQQQQQAAPAAPAPAARHHQLWRSSPKKRSWPSPFPHSLTHVPVAFLTYLLLLCTLGNKTFNNAQADTVLAILDRDVPDDGEDCLISNW
jgi:sRNA-binding protein